MADRVLEIDLSQSVSTADLPRLARSFFAWWTRELLDLIPARYRGVVRSETQRLTVLPSGAIWRLRRSGAEDVIVDPQQNDQDFSAAVAIVVGAMQRPEVRVVLPDDCGLVRRIELPMLSEARARAAAQLQIDRLTPFSADSVRFSSLIVERDIETNRMTVDVAVVPSAPLQQIEARLGAANIKPASIDIAAPESEVGQGFDLSTRPPRGEAQTGWLVDLAIGSGAAFLWLMVFYAWTTAGEVEIARWQAKAAEVKPAAERSAALKREIDLLTKPLEIARAHKGLSVLSLMKEITGLLPDNAHLIELRVSDDGAEIAGFADDAPSLIGKLEKAKMFADVRFKSPVVRRPNTDKDRFDIALPFEGGGRR